MSSANAADVDIGILARNQPISNNNGEALEEPVITTSRRDVYDSIAQGFDNCGNCCYEDIADGSTTSPAMPSTIGLRISGWGNVSLPIVDEQASKLKSVATHAAGSKKKGGDGEKKNVPVYEIGASKIKVQNPQFNESMGNLLDTVAYKLGVSLTFLSAKLDKLVYMEKGGYIERRRDDEDDDNVLGTLLIQLPSKFTGGEMTVYNASVMNEGDAEESFKFGLGAGEKATYSCHFACHFSDCEYEMAKLRSGSRVLLRYSLRYKQTNPVPTAGLIGEKTSHLLRSLNGLSPVDRMVVIPLEKQYRIHSLVNSGINALSNKHRRKAEALKAAGTDWELRIVNAKLEHTCSYYNCRSRASVIEIYDELGKCVTSEMSWLKKVVDFDNVDHNGMMLALDDENRSSCVSNWGACKSERRTYYDDSKKIYRATFLVSYDPAFETELKCLGGCGGVAEVCQLIVTTRDYVLLDRVLAVVSSKEKSKFDVKSCQILLQMLLKSRKKTASRVALVSNIITGLSSSEEPDELLYDTIIDAVEKFCHDKLGDAIEVLLNDVVRKRTKDITFFLSRMIFALKLNTRIEGETALNYLEAATNDLPRSLAHDIPDSTVSIIMNMISTYDDIDLSNMVEACLNYFHRGAAHHSLQTMLDRTHLLEQLLGSEKFGSLQASLVEFAADFARRAKFFTTLESKAKLLLEGEGRDVFIQASAFVIEFGAQTQWDEFGKYAIRTMDLFSAFINAVVSVRGQGLLRDVLNKCLVQYSITAHDTSICSWTVKKRNEPDIPPTPSLHVQKILELCPGIVQSVDKENRLPLHYAAAAASATASFDVFMTIFEANKDAASIRDPVTGLFPFQLAACHHNYAASFSLLLANPNLVSSAVTGASDVSDRKRKRSS
eukprot:scaffold6403_cov128-Skeletonema_dohrnii-CCMP3373.AAC.11